MPPNRLRGFFFFVVVVVVFQLKTDNFIQTLGTREKAPLLFEKFFLHFTPCNFPC